jgi:hypothetical protein
MSHDPVKPKVSAGLDASPGAVKQIGSTFGNNGSVNTEILRLVY